MLTTREKMALPLRRLGSRDLEDLMMNPFTDLFKSMRRNMTELFADLWDNDELELSLEPAVNMHVEENNLVVEALVPGLTREELKLETTPNLLTISGEAKREKETIKENVLCSQFSSYRKYHIQLQLPVEVKPEKAEAQLKNGVLTLKLPTVESIQGAKIPIMVKESP